MNSVQYVTNVGLSKIPFRYLNSLTRASPVLGATFAAPGGGGASRRPPTNSAHAHRREKRKKALESSSKTITKLLQSFFGSGQN